jgi:hypothetical protein
VLGRPAGWGPLIAVWVWWPLAVPVAIRVPPPEELPHSHASVRVQQADIAAVGAGMS